MLIRVTGIEYARTQAFDLLEKFGSKSTEHLRIDGLARWLGIDLLVTPMEGADAQLVAGPGGACIVLPTRQTDPAECRWSIAHELGHFVLDHPSHPADELCLPRRRRRRRDRRHLEDEANGFAAALLFPESIVASICDTRPMTLEVVSLLAGRCCAPWLASALRLIETTWRVCALVVSLDGVIHTVFPSLRFLMQFGDRIGPEEMIRPGTLAHRFFDTGALCGAPELVPASAWLDGCDPNLRLQEHSVAVPQHAGVMTMLWDPSDDDEPRPPEASLRAVAVYRDYLLDEVREDPNALARLRA